MTSGTRYVLTGHARRQLRRRQIPEGAIAHVLDRYDIRRPAPSREAVAPADILIGKFEGRRLKVYVERGSDPPKIKTVVWEGD